MMLKEKIMTAKMDSAAMMELIECFAPLLSKYSRLLMSEDAYSDLQLKFIETILQFKPQKMRSIENPYILSYLSRSLHNHFIFLSKQEKLNRSVAPISAMSKDQTNDIDYWDKICPPVFDSYRYDDYDVLYKNLTKYEAEIIILIYYFHFAVREVALHYGVSPSAISQAKSNAIKKLKEVL